MKLYYFETPNGQKACAVAKYLGSPVEYVRVDLTKGEQKEPALLAINPNGRIPALEDGAYKLWESQAIMCYLARKAGSDLWPESLEEQADALRWMNWETAHFSRHAGRLLFERFLKPIFGMGETSQEEVEDATKYFLQFCEVLNAHLKGRDHVAADRLTIADFAVASFLPWAEQAELPLDGFHEIARWHDRLMELPAWREPFPDAAQQQQVA